MEFILKFACVLENNEIIEKMLFEKIKISLLKQSTKLVSKPVESI